MSTARSELLIYVAVSLATTIGLFVVHKWYASYLDVRFHQQLDEAQPSEAKLALEDADRERLEGGKIPLEQAMSTLSKRGRDAASSIAPAPSDDLSAVAGWIHRPGFKPVTEHVVRAPSPAAARTSPAAPVPGNAAPDAPDAPGTTPVAPAPSAGTQDAR